MRADQENLKLGLYLEKYKDFYSDLVSTYQRKTDLYDNCVFAILSVHTAFDISKRNFIKYRKGNLRIEETGLPAIRPKHLDKLNTLYFNNDLHANGLTAIKFLGQGKRFFGLAFKDPDYFCLDTWMLRHYGLKDKPGPKVFRNACKKLEKDAHKVNYKPFAYQWAVWEYIQKRGHIDHSFLFC